MEIMLEELQRQLRSGAGSKLDDPLLFRRALCEPHFLALVYLLALRPFVEKGDVVFYPRVVRDDWESDDFHASSQGKNVIRE